MLLSLSVVLLLVLLYHTKIHCVVLETAKVKYTKFKSLKQLVSTQSTNIFKILWIMMVIIVKTLYVQLCQYFNGSIRVLDKNTYEVSYVIHGILYKMIVKPKRGPKCIIEAVDEFDNDVTHTILSYVGPMENFHGHHLTPKFLKKKKITLNLSSGEEKTFHEDDIIVLNNTIKLD